MADYFQSWGNNEDRIPVKSYYVSLFTCFHIMLSLLNGLSSTSFYFHRRSYINGNTSSFTFYVKNEPYSIQLYSMCFYILEINYEDQERRSTSNGHLLDLVNAALTSQMTGWSGACTHTLENGFAGRLQEERVLDIKQTHTHKHRILKTSLRVPIPSPQVIPCSARQFWNKTPFSVSCEIWAVML